MGRFFDKYELILIVTIFVLFDLNGACREFINHICFINKKHTLAFFIVLGALIYDVLLIHLVVTSTKSPPIKYAVDLNSTSGHATSACESDVQDQHTELEKKVSQLGSICSPDPSDQAFATSKKITVTFIVAVLCMIVLACLLMSPSSYPGIEINDFSTRLLRSSPLIITSIVLIYVTYL